jgi:DNA-binding MarR family transcriptional regulator
MKIQGNIVAEKQIKSFSSIMSLCIHKIIALDRAEKVCYGVTISQAYTIAAIDKRELITMKELSQELGLAISTLTRTLDVLVRDDIVCRYQSQQDRRKVNICLTDTGKDLARKLEECGEKFWSKIFKDIPGKKKQEITDNLRLLLKAIEGAEKVCCTKK